MKKYIVEFSNDSGEKHTEEVEVDGNKRKVLEMAKQQAKSKNVLFMMGFTPYYSYIRNVKK